jgi:peptidoglycan hydrolase-like protein with peptidoglycan-binding domain
MHVSVNSTPNHFDAEHEWSLFPRAHMSTADDPRSRPILRRGSKGEDVRTLQRVIGGLVIDGDFGPITEQAVRKFQHENELSIDGIVGPMTWAALDKIEQTPQASGDPLPLEDNMDAGNGE